MHIVVVGGSDAGIAAALRARELDPSTQVTVVVADAFPNFSICGIPYYVSGDVERWQDTFASALFHGMTVAELSDLDLSYTPPLGSPWDAVQVAGQCWERETSREPSR